MGRAHVDFESEDWKILSPPNHVVWKGMEQLVEKGLTKSIGISNSTMPLLLDILADCKIKPAVNQVECNPYLQQTDINRYHQKYGIYLQSYAPIGSNHFTGR